MDLAIIANKKERCFIHLSFFYFYLKLFLGFALVFFHQAVDSAGLVQKGVDGLIVVECVDKERDELAQVNLGVPGASEKLGGAVDEVGGEDFGDETFLVCLVHLLQTVAE